MLALKSTQNTVDLNCRIKSILDSARYVSFYGEETEFHTARGSNKIISCFGQNNLPDGEVYFGPELYSSEGRVLINVPTKYDGQGFKKLKLNFKNGRLLEKYARVLFKDNLWEEDEGALYIGEVGLGTNPANFRFVNDILLDEKKLGSFHIALGNSYPNSFNGNRSTIHWDLVHNLQSDDHSRIIVDGYVIYNGGKYNV